MNFVVIISVNHQVFYFSLRTEYSLIFDFSVRPVLPIVGINVFRNSVFNHFVDVFPGLRIFRIAIKTLGKAIQDHGLSSNARIRHAGFALNVDVGVVVKICTLKANHFPTAIISHNLQGAFIAITLLNSFQNSRHCRFKTFFKNNRSRNQPVGILL